jgi:hypothetical protein
MNALLTVFLISHILIRYSITCVPYPCAAALWRSHLGDHVLGPATRQRPARSTPRRATPRHKAEGRFPQQIIFLHLPALEKAFPSSGGRRLSHFLALSIGKLAGISKRRRRQVVLSPRSFVCAPRATASRRRRRGNQETELSSLREGCEAALRWASERGANFNACSSG